MSNHNNNHLAGQSLSARLASLAALLCLVLAVCSCWDADDPMNATPSSDLLRSDNIEVEADATEAVISVEANCHWTLTHNSDSRQTEWLTLLVASGEGTGEARLRLTVNQLPEERTATLRLTSAHGIGRLLLVRQKPGNDGGIPENGDNLRPDF